MRTKLAAAVGAALVSLGLSAVAQASLLVDFKPQPASANYYETSWSGSSLAVTPAGPMAEPGMFGGGAIGAGDGALPVAQQSVGGLQISTPFNITGVTGRFNDVGTGATTFYDVTLKLDLLAATAAANVDVVTPGITVLAQPVGRGTFQLMATDNQTVLLAGSITDMLIVGMQGGGTASVQSTSINYTGGKIYDALVAAGGPTSGNLSWSLLDVNNGGLKIGTGGNLAAFDANMTGLFSAQVPEPASLSLLGLGALGLIRRRRK